MKLRFGAVLAVITVLFGCQHEAKPLSVASYNVYSSYSEKLSGRYLLYVDGTKLYKDIKPSDLNCAAWNYPLKLSDGFSGSVVKTFGNLVGELEQVGELPTAEQLKSKRAKGIIIVRGEDLNGRLRVVPGFWQAGMETSVEVSASIVVDGPNGRLLGTTVSGNADAQTSAGAFCEGGANSLIQAAEGAMKEVVGRLGEALTNSDRVRKGM
ncbi:hypothetical protein [Rhizobium sp.]|uniref:hypothetical protein n=1 Tax=Rhizobium sp. TaxID=391 RepID=UPI000E9B8807|nr:hypothetical protein [Rhizobium sp.]